MKFKDRMLFLAVENILRKNKKFKNIHKGESCYLFGNGASLKYFDLKKFKDKPSIGCGALFLHRDFKELNVKYYYEGHSFFYYPYWVNPYSKKFKKNPMGAFYKQKKLVNKDMLSFCSLSNYLGMQGDNIFYAHHFGSPFNGFKNSKLDGSFSTMSSGLGGMLGLAIYMGFEDITLVGSDYSFFPQSQGHFFEHGRFPDTLHEEPIHKDLLLDAKQHADVRVITPGDEYQGHIVPCIGYKRLTGKDPVYRENSEILSDLDLLKLDSFGMLYKIFPK